MTRRTLKRIVTYRIGVYTIPGNVLCRHAIRYSVNVPLLGTSLRGTNLAGGNQQGHLSLSMLRK